MSTAVKTSPFRDLSLFVYRSGVGVLVRKVMRDLGLPLVSVVPIERGQANERGGDADSDRCGHGSANS